MTILVVDNDGFIRRITKQYLEHDGLDLRVQTVATPEEALILISSDITHFNAYIIDVFCGEPVEKRAGLKLTDRIRSLAEEKEIKPLILMMCPREKAPEAGDLRYLGIDLLLKPIADLVEVIEKLGLAYPGH
jgi:CheY-like chemotaxis protein